MEDVRALKEGEKLHIWNYEKATLPQDFFATSTLEALIIRSTPREAPSQPDLSNLFSLKQLFVNYNKLTSLPPQLGELTPTPPFSQLKPTNEPAP